MRHYIMTTQLRWLLSFLLFVVLAGPALQGCASSRDRELKTLSRVYDRPYEKVWDALEDVVIIDLKCVPKKENREDGYLETEWVHLFDTEGTKRWMVRARLKKVKSGVRLTVDKRFEMQDDISRNISKYKKQPNEPTASSWKRQDIDRKALDELYKSIEENLGL